MSALESHPLPARVEDLVPGRRYAGAGWSGVFESTEIDRHDGVDLYCYFTDGHLGNPAVPQAHLGWPASQFEDHRPHENGCDCDRCIAELIGCDAANDAQVQGIAESVANFAANNTVELVRIKAQVGGTDATYSDDPSEIEAQFIYTRLDENDLSEGLEVTIFAANGDVVSSQDFG